MNVPYAKWIVGSNLIAGSLKEETGKEKKSNKNYLLSKGQLKCRNPSGLAMVWVLNKVRNKLTQTLA